MAGTKEKVSNNIPHDLVLSILSKLSIKSLKRFSCVTASWADLFENPHFMTMYLCKYENDDNSSLLWNNVPQTFTSHRDNLLMLSGERFENKVELNWPPPIQDDDDIYFIYKLGSVINGTLCFYQVQGSCPEIENKVVLWNPTTDEFKVIPPGSVDCPLGFVIIVDLHGFGYDPLTNDYKLIRRIGFFEDNFWYGYRQNIPEPSWQIYSLKSNSWKNVDVEMPYKSSDDEVYLNGMCHWCSVEEEMVLVSFNLSDEVCHKTPLDWNDCYDYRSRTLVALNNSIAMITMHAGTTCFDISILGEIGVRESWTRIITIGPLPCVADPIGVWKKGNLFFWKNKDELARFNVSTQLVEEIGVIDQHSYCQIVIYKESLLPIGGINS